MTYLLLAVVAPLTPPAALVVGVFLVCVAGVVYFGAGLIRGRK